MSEPEAIDQKNALQSSAPIVPDVAESFDRWLEHFYKECGREVTLAYTTLNQMKNWAMIVVGALLTAVAQTSRSVTDGAAGLNLNVATVVVAVIAYAFSLRFYVRAIICYVNLIRWNTLQAGITSYTLVRSTKAKTAVDARSKLIADIQNYYNEWASPIDRKTQLVSCLKLGFALLITLPAFFVVIGAVALWKDAWVKGLLAFTVGNTIVEVLDYRNSWFCDTPEERALRNQRREETARSFPTPSSRDKYLAYWFFNFAGSLLVALWPKIFLIIVRLSCCFTH